MSWKGSILIMVLILTAPGCRIGEEPASPLVTVAELGGGDHLAVDRMSVVGGFYPLEMGNLWNYEGVFRVEIIEDGSEPSEPAAIYLTEERVLDGTEEIQDHEYMVERRTIREDLKDDPYMEWVRYRQDKAGLYEADVSITQPPAIQSASTSNGDLWRARWHRVAAGIAPEREGDYRRAWDQLVRKSRLVRTLATVGPSPVPPGGVWQGELTRLAYPLHPGAHWFIREDPEFESIVEAHEMLDLPAGRFGGYRIRIRSDVFGPDDEVYLWYGRAGFLGLYAHLIAIATNAQGERIGVVDSEETRALSDLDLGRPGRK